MLKLNKVLACVLSLCLLGQSALFAAPQPPREPQTLAEYQARAKEEVRRSPWIQREGKYILGAGGAVAAGFILQGVYYRRKMTKMNQEYVTQLGKTYEYYGNKLAEQESQRKLKEFQRSLTPSGSYLDELDQVAARLRKEMWADKDKIELLEKQIAELQAANKQLEKELVRTGNKAKGLQTAAEVRQGRVQALKEELVRLKKEYDLSELRYYFLTSTKAEKWGGRLDAYVKIFDSSVPESERLALRKQLAQEPWLLQATKSQQKDFLRIIDRASDMAVHASKTSAEPYMHSMIRVFVDKELPIYERLAGLCSRVFTSKNLVWVGLIVVLGTTAQTASAQRMADRVNKNFDLFLNATPQELAEMEKDKEVVKVCMQGAEVLHQMSQMNEEEQEILSQAWRAKGAPKPARASQAQLAR